MQNVAVLTGAGISAESGLKTFRDSDGLWENYHVDDVATYQAWKKKTDLVRNFYNERRKQLFSASPNEAHKQLVRLENKFNVQIITQNVDDLHERAGSTKVLHLHGELKKLVSETDPFEIVTLKDWKQTPDMKDKSGYPLRPFIVWFGEPVPMIEPAIKICQKADILLVIGTSLNVYPAAGLIHYCSNQCKKYLIDPQETNGGIPNGFIFVKDVATKGVKQVVEELLIQN
ncbi:MAG: NAD-dependent deacylase [Bacteroidales bacterium]|jgi:NAD-dependent deacetylase|nr:NAD-dependent deacylase [Bacteroidales bacterium]